MGLRGVGVKNKFLLGEIFYGKLLNSNPKYFFYSFLERNYFIIGD